MLELYFFNVGHGDSIAIKFPNNDWGVIDCNRNINETIPPVLNFLQKNNVEHLCFLCITHPHEDHYNGVDKIIEKYSKNIDKLILYGLTKNDKETQEISSLGRGLNLFYINNKRNIKSKIEFARMNNSINIDDLEIKILNPTNDDIKNIMLQQCFASSIEYNSVSVVLFFKYKKCKILLTGDSTVNNWKHIFKFNVHKYLSDIIKISHHGSIENNSDELLKNLINHESYSIISSDGGYKYKTLPSVDVINSLDEKFHSQVLQTASLNHQQLQTVENIPASDIEEAVLDTVAERKHLCRHYDGYIRICIDDSSNITYSFVESI